MRCPPRRDLLSSSAQKKKKQFYNKTPTTQTIANALTFFAEPATRRDTIYNIILIFSRHTFHSSGLNITFIAMIRLAYPAGHLVRVRAVPRAKPGRRGFLSTKSGGSLRGKNHTNPSNERVKQAACTVSRLPSHRIYEPHNGRSHPIATRKPTAIIAPTLSI